MLRMPMSTSSTYQRIAAVLMPRIEGDIVHPNHLAALGVDNLLIEQIANHAQHVFVGMIRREVFVFEIDAVES